MRPRSASPAIAVGNWKVYAGLSEVAALDDMDSMEALPEQMADADTLPSRQLDWTHPDGMLDIPEGVVACQFCGFTRFRRSRVRLGDLSEFALLRLPVRCMRCNQRQYQGVLASALANGLKSHGPRLAKGRDTWKNWTEQEMAGKMHRPMTTALGPRATKLGTPKPGTPRSGSASVQADTGPEKPAWRDDDRQIW